MITLEQKKTFGRGNLFGVSALITASTVGGLRDFARVINRIFLSLNLIGWGQNKRNDVAQIASQLEIADAIFGGREATTGNTSAVRRLDVLCPLQGLLMMLKPGLLIANHNREIIIVMILCIICRYGEWWVSHFICVFLIRPGILLIKNSLYYYYYVNWIT